VVRCAASCDACREPLDHIAARWSAIHGASPFSLTTPVSRDILRRVREIAVRLWLILLGCGRTTGQQDD
jgi:hypothetical protein